jgi:hypothetical protein
VGERLLAAKLRLLSGSSDRGTSAALSILTGGSRTQLPSPEQAVRPAPTAPAATAAPAAAPRGPARSRYAARTVYLSERHLRDLDRIVEAWQSRQPRRWNRSAVLRRAIEQLCTSIETDAPATFEQDPLLENA